LLSCCGSSEIQDANGTTSNGVTSAAGSFGNLIAAIDAAGGPAYQFRQIDPENIADGGVPGGAPGRADAGDALQLLSLGFVHGVARESVPVAVNSP